MEQRSDFHMLRKMFRRYVSAADPEGWDWLRTPRTNDQTANAVKTVALAFLFFVIHGRFPSLVRPDDGRYLAGLAAIKLHTPVVAPGLLKTHAQPRTLGQARFVWQKPPQVVV
jgi:hypothetical protein